VTQPRLRLDDLSGEWVIDAPDRADRPNALSASADEGGDCPFCPGNEAQTPPELMRLGTDEWRTRVFPNKYPSFVKSAAPDGGTGEAPATGIHEVIVESPRHDAGFARLTATEMEDAIETWFSRIAHHESRGDVRQLVLFKNERAAAGESIRHVHSQLAGFSYAAPAIESELAAIAAGEGCALCRQLESEIGSGERLIAASDSFAAIAPFASRFPWESRVIPRRHGGSPASSGRGERQELARLLRRLLGAMDAQLRNPAFNLVIRTAPLDDEGTFHWNLRVLPRVATVGGFELATGTFINIIRPEDAAADLRNAYAGSADGGDDR
jgi:UDPglucose--hexose-1-phosphate uridylyltransferase